jgi:hypothetical protein
VASKHPETTGSSAVKKGVHWPKVHDPRVRYSEDFVDMISRLKGLSESSSVLPPGSEESLLFAELDKVFVLKAELLEPMPDTLKLRWLNREVVAGVTSLVQMTWFGFEDPTPGSRVL